MVSLEIFLFGGFRVRRASGPNIEIGRRKA